MARALLQLASGSDVRGTAFSSDSSVAFDLTDDVVSRIAKAFLFWMVEQKILCENRVPFVSVGMDSRLSSPRIKDAVIHAIRETGAHVFDCSLASTPAMFCSLHDLSCDAAVEVTASHLPFDRNGLKFFTPRGGLDHDHILSVLAYAKEGRAPSFERKKGKRFPVNYMKQYAEHLREQICLESGRGEHEQPLRGLKIVVDASNGVGGFFTDSVLRPLGACTEGSVFLTPNGLFPNHVPNPEDAKAMDAIVEATQKKGADLGVIFDTDVDRAAVVDEGGRPISGDRMVALAAAIALESRENACVVADSVVSDRVERFISRQLKGKLVRFQRGYRQVINEAIRLNCAGMDCPLAIETSGHAAFIDHDFLDDGAFLVARIIAFMVRLKDQGRTLSSVIEALGEPAFRAEARIAFFERDPVLTASEVIARFHAFCEKQSDFLFSKNCSEGVRVSFCSGMNKGWLLLRKSIHDPVLPFHIEFETLGNENTICSRILTFFESLPQLDTKELCKALRECSRLPV